ncbi:MAG: DUF3987 domain-containing protein, partial [Promethearchaeota archaeon]
MTTLLDLYIEYHKMRTDSPKTFATHLGIQLIGHSLGRDSFCSTRPRGVRFNVELCLLGQSGKAMKSTAQEDIQVPLIPSSHKGTKSFTPEGLLREMELKPQILCPMGEFSTVLRGIKMGGHMANFKEITNDLFNCPYEYNKKLANKENNYHIDKPYLSISTTCTEEEFFPYLKPEMVHGGFLPRWLLIYDCPKNRKKRDDLPEFIDGIENILKSIFELLYVYFAEKPAKFKLDNDARDVYESICFLLEEGKEYEKIQPFVKRIENYIIAYACI